jgi:hypothetical protein
VARVDGIAASVGRCGLFGPVVRLFGAATLPAFRGRGLYREIVAARCRLGKEHGAALAMTKGRHETSAPILIQAGFLSFQTERCWRLRGVRIALRVKAGLLKSFPALTNAT